MKESSIIEKKGTSQMMRTNYVNLVRECSNELFVYIYFAVFCLKSVGVGRSKLC